MATKKSSKKELSKKDVTPSKKAEPKGSWFKKGDEGFNSKRSQDTAAKLRKEKGITRFFLKEGESAKVVFVDETPFFCNVHQLKVGDSWRNFVTCTRDFAPCPVCNDGHKATYVAHLTCIDTREFDLKDGKKVKNRKVLYPAKGSTILKLEDLKKKYGGLKGLAFNIKRYTKDDPNCGSDLEKLGKVDLSKLGKDATVPYDYMKVLAPPTEEELAAVGIGSVIAGSTEDLGSTDADLNELL